MRHDYLMAVDKPFISILSGQLPLEICQHQDGTFPPRLCRVVKAITSRMPRGCCELC